MSKLSRSLTSPCQNCTTTSCCTHLEVHRFHLRSQMDMDQVGYFLNFEQLEICVKPEWSCSVYYVKNCRHLTNQRTCEVHDSPEQPKVCTNYNPYKCFYKPATADKSSLSEELVWLNIDQWESLSQKFILDEDRTISAFPTWNDLKEVKETIQYVPRNSSSYQGDVEEDSVYKKWHQSLTKENTETSQTSEKTSSLENVASICESCEAWCCTHLSFPHPPPESFRDVDYLKYAINFPGVQIGVTDSNWFLVIQTKCRHLAGSRCGVFGQESRPLTCRYYPEQSCGYIQTIGAVRPTGYLRIGRKQFKYFTETLSFDSIGNLTGLPTVDTLRTFIETSVRTDCATSPVLATRKPKT